MLLVKCNENLQKNVIVQICSTLFATNIGESLDNQYAGNDLFFNDGFRAVW